MLSSCGKKPITETDEYFIYTLLEDGSYSIGAKDKNNLPEDLVLPGFFQGKKVSCVAEGGFSGCNIIVTVTIHENIKYINNEAFSRCNNLVIVNLHKQILGIGNGSFANCPNFLYINYDGTEAQWDNVSLYGNWNVFSDQMVVNCTDGIVRPKSQTPKFD